jgi:hypothetical protein
MGRQAGHFPEPDKMKAEDAIQMADDLMDDAENRMRDLSREIYRLGEKLRKSQRALADKDWQELWQLDLLTDPEVAFLDEVHGLYSW